MTEAFPVDEATAPEADMPPPGGELLHEIFARSAARFGYRRALRLLAPDAELTRKPSLAYWELRQRSAQFANHLRALGVGRGDRVVICLPRSLDQYMAILGVLEAGAAYVPVDWTFPHDRVDFVIADCAARAVITLQERAASFSGGALLVAIDDQLGEIAAAASTPLSRAQTGADPQDDAYIIYTSGSSGRPKGVVISHHNICHLVRAESEVLGLTCEDRVFGGFSLAFDMSVETMWTAFFAGAELLAASEAMAKAGPDLAEILTQAQVTVWHAVPSLLAAIDQDVPCARLINLGGEACTAELVRRWSRPGRRLLNTYGPTEATVTATWTELAPDRPVTIGKPLPGYRVWIVDDGLEPAPAGTEGELLIGGPGVGRGYLNQPELTAEKFIDWPAGAGDAQRVYRTGDMGRINPDGEIEFLGRIDTQVKIRGFRVELGEIEAILAEDPAVAQAVVRVFDDDGDGGLLAAFVTPRSAGGVDIEALEARAQAALPAYMRPACWQVLDVFPTLVSGKVDLAALPKPARRPAQARVLDAPAGDLETRLVEVWSEVFAPQPVGVLDDFFEILGGHSLKAARMVSIARRQPALARLSISDLYAAPTIRALAGRLEQGRRPAAAPQPPFLRPPPWRRLACVAGQTAALPAIYAFAGLQWMAPYIAYTWLVSNDTPRVSALMIAAPSVLIMPPLMIGLSVLLKWIVLGRMRAGDYPLWGGYFFRWWLVRRLLGVMPTRFMAGTPLMAAYFRLLGARIGKDAYLDITDLDAPDMIHIGDGALLSREALLAGVSIERGLFRVGPVHIGEDAFLGVRSVVGRGSTVGPGAVLEDLSALSPGAQIGPGERWDGSPARRMGPAPPRPAPPPPSMLRRWMVSAGLIAAGALLPLVAVAPVAPGLIAMVEIDWRTRDYLYLAASPALALAYVILMCLLTVGAKWALLGRVRPGAYSIWSGFYVRFWFVRQLGELALELLHPIYATLYVTPWYRAFGARVGPRAEISTATSVVHDLVDIGPESFIADGVVFGGSRIEPGVLHLDETRIGRRSFVGNSGLLPAGSEIGDGVLIGVLSKPPPRAEDALEPGSTWFGSPPIRLPHRQSFAVFDEGATFRPSRRLFLARLLIEYVRVTLPLTVFIALFSVVLSVLGDLADAPGGLWAMVAAFPALYLGFCLAAGGFVVLLKWAVIGRYESIVRPLWSFFVWRSELVTAAYENLAAPLLLDPLRGTPYLNLYLRLMGCRIGRRAYIDTTDITEFDLVRIGDDAVLNDGAGLQTHLFEDRVMKVSGVEIGDRAVVGTMAIALYDSVIEADAQLGDLSVLMKGERLPAGTSWEGSPAQLADTPT